MKNVTANFMNLIISSIILPMQVFAIRVLNNHRRNNLIVCVCVCVKIVAISLVLKRNPSPAMRRVDDDNEL